MEWKERDGKVRKGGGRDALYALCGAVVPWCRGAVMPCVCEDLCVMLSNVMLILPLSPSLPLSPASPASPWTGR